LRGSKDCGAEVEDEDLMVVLGWGAQAVAAANKLNSAVSLMVVLKQGRMTLVHQHDVMVMVVMRMRSFKLSKMEIHPEGQPKGQSRDNLPLLFAFRPRADDRP